MIKSITTLYNRLSNRTIALIILVLTIPALVYWGNYFFRFNVGEVTFVSNLRAPFEVEVRSGEIKIATRSCRESCKVEGLPAGKYSYRATTAGRSPLGGEVTIERANPRSINLEYQYEVSVSEKPTDTTSTGATLSGSTVSEFNIDDWVTPATLGYSTGSLEQGYFVMIDSSERYTIVDTLSRDTLSLRLPTGTTLTRIKSLGDSDTLVLTTNQGVMTYTPDSAKLEPLPYYADIERDQYGRLIGLIRAGQTSTLELFGITGTTGDLLVDASEPGAPKVLKWGFDPISQIRARGETLILELTSGKTLELKWSR